MTSDTASQIFNFLKENWDEIGLLCYTIFRCIVSIYLFKEREIREALFLALVYYPTLVLLVASLFYNASWMWLSGYVLASSLSIAILSWSVNDEDDKELGKFAEQGVFTVLLCLSMIFG